jgi:alpha-tubulin suppressor-like RCC1 family protein
MVLQKVAQVACGWRHTLAFTEKKNVFAWGRGTSGQLGHGEIVDRWFLWNVFIFPSEALVALITSNNVNSRISSCTILKEYSQAD